MMKNTNFKLLERMVKENKLCKPKGFTTIIKYLKT